MTNSVSPQPVPAQTIRLGLIGTGIGRSLTPFLQERAGQNTGLPLHYDLFDTPKEAAAHIGTALKDLRNVGYTGVNVTHPFKEVAFGLVNISDPMVARIGAINTVRFNDGQGFNTDYSGFIRAYRQKRGQTNPGVVVVVGAGGAGKAVSFALLTLGASELRVLDTDTRKAEQLATALRDAGGNATAFHLEDLPSIGQTNGLVNCTPLGMYQYPGNPIPSSLVGNQDWAFDAIYTPLMTEFLLEAQRKGLDVIPGLDLMFYQALDAFEIWTGRVPNQSALMQELLAHIKAQNRE